MSQKDPLKKQKKRRKDDARRHAWMEKKLARNLIVPDMAALAEDVEGENMAPEKSHTLGDAQARLQRMLNRLAETEMADDAINALASALLEQMEDGYRLTFPIVMCHGRTLQCVALLARATDRRLRAIRELRVAPQATHVFVFHAFASEHEWLEQATQMTRLFPEQPDKPERVVGVK